jgi:GTP-binding protein EngB required for normal cell division
MGQDLQGRLQRLDRTSDEVELLKVLERIIHAHGLVEFRSTLSLLLDQLESNNFQIAVFGRVSSGKSSLLNHILETDVRPVGVNPITAVPTRIVHGPEPRLLVSFLAQKREAMEVRRLAEFVSEPLNPGNRKHVTQVTVELPSQRLQDGVVFVDTPGLGSLATAGAAETLAYLPRCDVGVVLIDAGASLNQEDLSTLQSLYEAAIPPFVLLSKADLLTPEDRVRAIEYISGQIRSQLGLELSVHPVSTRGDHAGLLDEWLRHEIQPLCERHQELAQQSLRRKAGALREAVEAALKLRLEISEKRPGRERGNLGDAETRLRKATGKFEDVNSFCLRAADEIRRLGWMALSRSAAEATEQWFHNGAQRTDAEAIIARNLTAIAADGASQVFGRIRDLARDLSAALAGAADALGVEDAPRDGDLTSFVREMPRLDPQPPKITLPPGYCTVLGRAFTKWWIERKLKEEAGTAVEEMFHHYGRMMESWSGKTLAELHRRFDGYADGYRAQLERLSGGGEAEPEEAGAIRRDLETLSRFRGEQPSPARESPR